MDRRWSLRQPLRSANHYRTRQFLALLQCREAEGPSASRECDELVDRALGDLPRLGPAWAASITILDECWALLESPNLADTVVQLFRTARKRDASVWGISQKPEDFVGTAEDPKPSGAGIMKNATTKIIGKQPGDMSALREHLHLNETAINQIKTFSSPKKGYSSDFLITIGEKSESTHTIRVVPSPIEYWITTTYARERHYRRWFLHTHTEMSKFEAYELLAQQFPRGLAQLEPLPEEVSGAVVEVAP
jgi:hypothetical protein